MRAGTAIAVAGLAALAPAAAQAKSATKSVTMGTPLSAQSKFGKLSSDVNDFFPHGVKIHVGDKVKFLPTGFHTVNFPPPGQGPQPLVAPNGKILGVNDAAGVPFWFNGQDNLQFNPALFAQLYGKKVTFKPSQGLESGLPLAQHPQPFVVTFKKAGRYTYFCNLHPGMKGTVTVVKKSKKVPSAKADRKTVSRAIAADLKVAKQLSKIKPPPKQVSVGNSGAHGVEYFGMLPGTLTVSPGTTVSFHMSRLSFEDHTATFGPGNPETEPQSYLGQIAASFQGASLDQRGVYPSEPPGSTALYTSSLHGNGFWNTGVMDASSATPLPSSGTVTFTQPGKYSYYCVIHPFMHGVINVQ
jgi:plastocyanin